MFWIWLTDQLYGTVWSFVRSQIRSIDELTILPMFPSFYLLPLHCKIWFIMLVCGGFASIVLIAHWHRKGNSSTLHRRSEGQNLSPSPGQFPSADGKYRRSFFLSAKGPLKLFWKVEKMVAIEWFPSRISVSWQGDYSGGGLLPPKWPPLKFFWPPTGHPRGVRFGGGGYSKRPKFLLTLAGGHEGGG